jgi:hypothetical protein
MAILDQFEVWSQSAGVAGYQSSYPIDLRKVGTPVIAASIRRLYWRDALAWVRRSAMR